jgi:serpin B
MTLRRHLFLELSLSLAAVATLAAGCGSGGAKPAPAAPPSASSTALAPAASASDSPAAATSGSSASASVSPPPSGSKGGAATIADSTVAFGDDLLARLDDKAGNLVFAPASIAAALAMTYGGARGATASEMAKTLHLDGLEEAKVHASWSELLGSWMPPGATGATSAKSDKEPQVEVANRLFGQQGYSFQPAFLALTKDRYGAALEPVDYAGATEGARAKINQWVSERTAKAIPELIAKGVLDKDTRLTLVNAIHLKGAWLEPFVASATQPAKFHAPGADVDVPTMNGTRHARFAETKDAQIVALPFASAGAYDLELDVVLPAEPAKGAAAAKPSLRAWSAAIDAAESSFVALALPRFKVNGSFALAPTLAAMGMPTGFSRTADFSGIDGTKKLYVSAVVHQAVLDVYESGAEASAATAVAMGIKGFVRAPHVMKVDRPFYVMLRDHKTGAILFVAHVRNPKA